VLAAVASESMMVRRRSGGIMPRYGGDNRDYPADHG
jgi:hypothetical protein